MEYGIFSGNPKTEWINDDGFDIHMKLLEDFSFSDPDGREWKANKNDVINGASIPKTLWSSVGSPYTGDYRRASVVHDIACGDKTISREDADKMFYFACLAGGCSKLQAKLLYAGVRIGDWIGPANILMAPQAFAKHQRYQLPSEHTKEELEIRSKYTLIAKKLEETPDDFEEIRRVVNGSLQ